MSEQPNPPTQLEMERLMFIKQVFKTGVDQSRQPAPIAYQSVLSFHDAAELMLQLCCERKNCSLPKRPDFFDYWFSLERAGVSLSRQGGMKRLNNSRVALKHYSNLPNIDDVEAFRAATTAFLEDACNDVFFITIDEIDRSYLVQDEKIRIRLKEAGSSLAAKDGVKALELAASAFRSTVNTRTGWQSLLNFGTDTFSPFANGFVDKDVRRAVEQLSDQFRETMLVIACGGDLVGYKLLKVHGPVAHGIMNGPPLIEWMREPEVDLNVARRCVDFVTDLVFRLQEAEAIPMPVYPSFGVIKLDTTETASTAAESEADGL